MKSYKGSNFLIGWSVDVNAEAVWAKGGVGLGKCQDGCGSRLHWKKWRSRERFRELGVSNLKKLHYIHMMYILFYFCFFYV